MRYVQSKWIFKICYFLFQDRETFVKRLCFLIKQCVDINIGLRSAMINICTARVRVSLVTVGIVSNACI